jgi:8-oxo-dGTP diphosphatase
MALVNTLSLNQRAAGKSVACAIMGLLEKRRMQEREVVTCFLVRTGPGGEDEVLILHRSGRVGTYQGRWAGVSGYVEAEPLAQARREIAEETGLAPEQATLLRVGEPLPFTDEELDVRWVVHPFLFRVAPDASITVDWEHVEARWISPQELAGFDTVPRLKEAFDRVYPPTRSGSS